MGGPTRSEFSSESHPPYGCSRTPRSCPLSLPALLLVGAGAATGARSADLKVRDLLHDGSSFPELASILEAAMPAFVDERIGRMLTLRSNDKSEGSHVGHSLQN